LCSARQTPIRSSHMLGRYCLYRRLDPCILNTLYVLHIDYVYVRKLHTLVICNEYIFRCHPIGILVDTGSCHLGYIQNRKRCKSISSAYRCNPQVACHTGVQMNNNLYRSCNRRFHKYDLPLVCSRFVRSSYICNRRCTLNFPMASSSCGD
jgi:hypothetical protein